MKILMVSMNSIHFRRWTAQLEHSGHEVYWFDIKDQGYIPSLHWVQQVVGWKKGFLKKRGRTLLKKYVPNIYKKLSLRYDVTIENAFAKAVQDIKPDLVHSFALYISCTPILGVMNRFRTIPWLYSSWGSDLYYFQNIPEYLKDIKAVLPRVTHLMTDCKRDLTIAATYGFTGEHLGVFPGGGGFDLEKMLAWIQPIKDRKTLLVKGYQGRSGRAIEVIKALEGLPQDVQHLRVVVFGAVDEVVAYCKDSLLEIEVHTILEHNQVLQCLGMALIYIGNSNSDGMPNTLLEAMCMGAFPIQSNPGGATEELIKHRKNGLLIEDCNNITEIRSHISTALQNPKMLKEASAHNQSLSASLERSHIRELVLKAYLKIE